MLRMQFEPGSAIETKSGISKKTGQPYAIPEQFGLCTLVNGERRRISLQFDGPNDAPFPGGEYEPKPSALYVDKFGGLSISTRAKHWQPVGFAAKKAG